MAIRPFFLLFRALVLGFAGWALAACQQSDLPKQLKPVPFALTAKMVQLGMKETSPILIRIYKESSELEIWKAQDDGKFALLKTYAICKWSGELGPKVSEGDRQAPEGFYTVTPAQMNPNSNYYLSFNIGYPNAYDRAYGRTGSNLMVHGACSSSGCYSMTDEDAGEIFALARDAFRGGQVAFQIEAFPFRMTPENLARHAGDANMPFWRMLKVGADHFEVTRHPPKVDVCEKKYVFDADAGTASFTPVATCPTFQVPASIATAAVAKADADDLRFNQLAAASGVPETKVGVDTAPTGATVILASVAAAAPASAGPWWAHPAKAARVALGDPTDLTPRGAPSSAKKIAVKPPAPPTRPVAEAKPAAKLPLPPKSGNPARIEAATPAPAKAETTPVAGVSPTQANAPVVAAAKPMTAASVAATGPQVGKFVKKKFLWPDDDAPTVKGTNAAMPDIGTDGDTN